MIARALAAAMIVFTRPGVPVSTKKERGSLEFLISVANEIEPVGEEIAPKMERIPRP